MLFIKYSKCTCSSKTEFCLSEQHFQLSAKKKSLGLTVTVQRYSLNKHNSNSERFGFLNTQEAKNVIMGIVKYLDGENLSQSVYILSNKV